MRTINFGKEKKSKAWYMEKNLINSKKDYKKLLPADEFKKCEATVKKYPESIYGPEDNQALQDTLDEIYGDTISFVGRKLIDLGFDVKNDFESYLGE